MTRTVDHRTVLSRLADQAEVLAEQLRFYENCVGRADADRSDDRAVYTADPCADVEKFDREYDAYVAGIESGLAETTAKIERFVTEYRVELLELAAFGRPEESEPPAEEFIPIVDRGQLVSVAEEFATGPDSDPSDLVQVECGVLTWEIWR